MLEAPGPREVPRPVAGRARKHGVPLQRSGADGVALAVVGGEQPLFEVLAWAEAALQHRACEKQAQRQAQSGADANETWSTLN